MTPDNWIVNGDGSTPSKSGDEELRAAFERMIRRLSPPRVSAEQVADVVEERFIKAARKAGFHT